MILISYLNNFKFIYLHKKLTMPAVVLQHAIQMGKIIKLQINTLVFVLHSNIVKNIHI